jgi:hypothetical protein
MTTQTAYVAEALQATGINPVSIDCPSNILAGVLLVAWLYTPPYIKSGTTGVSPVTAFSDTVGNSWNFAGSQTLSSGQGVLYAYWTLVTNALTTTDSFQITCTEFNSSIYIGVIVNGYTLSNSIVAANQDFFSSGLASSLVSKTPSYANELFIASSAFLSEDTSGTPTFTLDTSDGWGGATSILATGGDATPKFAWAMGGGWLLDTTTAQKTFAPTAGGDTFNTPALAILALSSTFGILAAEGSYAVTGDAAALLRGHLLAAAEGSYAVTGDAAALLRGHLLAAAEGSYAVTGAAAALLRKFIEPESEPQPKFSPCIREPQNYRVGIV